MPPPHLPLPTSRRIAGADGPWDTVRADLAGTGTALVHSRCTDWAGLTGDENAMRELLGHEAPRWSRMPHNATRRAFGVSRALLKHTVGAVVGAPAASVELAKRPVGRPYARGCDRIEVSLSHTDGVVVVGLSTVGAIGVDVERADRMMLRDGMEQRICSPAELTELRRLAFERRNAELLRLWMLKEAYTKAVGQGLRFPFQEFGFTTEARPRLRGPDGDPADSGAWTFGTGPVDDAYRAAVAVLDGGHGRIPEHGPVQLVDHEVASLLSGSVVGA